MISLQAQKGFTIVELVVSVAIFAFMTAFLVARYGTFNQSILLSNLAYDVALTIRNAQTYGLNVKSRPSNGLAYSTDAAGFTYGYGVRFSTGASGTPTPNTQMIFFADVNENKQYETSELISTYTLKNGSTISAVCAGVSETACTVQTNPTSIDIIFKRPDPNADIRIGGTKYNYTEITVRASGGSTKKVAVRSTGQIAVLQF